jgi:phosphate:Na+ symporter
LVLLLLLDPLVNLVTKLIKDKEDDMKELLYIDENFLQTPAVAIEQALKELHCMLLLARNNINRAFYSLVNEDMSESKMIADTEYRIDFLTGEITSFLIKISSSTKSADDEKLVGGLHHVANDIERLGDYAVLLVKETNYMKQKEVTFLEQTKMN